MLVCSDVPGILLLLLALEWRRRGAVLSEEENVLACGAIPIRGVGVGRPLSWFKDVVEGEAGGERRGRAELLARLGVVLGQRRGGELDVRTAAVRREERRVDSLDRKSVV